MIHCVNLNATSDYLFLCQELELGGVNKAAAVLSYPGGKGNNAARAVALLSGGKLKPGLFAFSGAKERPASSRFFRGQGVRPELVAVPGENRPCLVLMDGGRDQETVVNSPSKLKLGTQHLARLSRALLKAVRPGDVVTFSGSIPDGFRPDAYKRLIAQVQAKGGVALLDAYGPALARGVEAAPFLVKPNEAELGESFGVSVSSRAKLLRQARALLKLGIRVVVVTLAERGAVAVTRQEALYAQPLPRPRGLTSPVGCGDAFLAGLAWSLHQGKNLADCLRLATASAWANLTTPGAIFFARKLALSQVAHVKVSRISE